MAATDSNLNITFKIVEDGFPSLSKTIKEYEEHYVTYLIHNKSKIYAGETSHLKNRFKMHSSGKSDYRFSQSKIILSDYLNKSAVYDLESRLINYFHADDKFEVTNLKKNQNSH